MNQIDLGSSDGAARFRSGFGSKTRRVLLRSAPTEGVDETRDARADELFAAVRKGEHAAVMKLLRLRQRPNVGNRHVQRDTGPTLLMEAARHDRKDIIILLLANGANLEDHLFTGGGTALVIAARAGSANAVDVLLAAGAKIDPVVKTPPLMEAAFHGHLEIVKRLVEKGARIEWHCRVASYFMYSSYAIRCGGHGGVAASVCSRGGDA